MSQKLNIKLLKIKIALASVLLMTSLSGCTNKIKTTQIQDKKQDLSALLTPKKSFDFNASTEQEAALLVWDLYSYIKELESSLNACLNINKEQK